MDENRRARIRTLIEGHTRTVLAGTPAQARTALQRGQRWSQGGGIFQDVGPRGASTPNYTTVRDNTRLPPTTAPGEQWTPISEPRDPQNRK